MKIISTAEEIRSERSKMNGTVALVPTMGALHPGHEALLKTAAQYCNSVIATLFVNPKQFDDLEDYEKYPRDLNRDMEIFKRYGVTCAFVPTAETMYGTDDTFSVSAGLLGAVLEGRYRQDYFTGVSTVIAKFFALIRPDVAYFGEKDAQQLAIVRKLNAELMFGVEIVPVKTVRESSGLAWSSRNGRLNAEGKHAATSIYAGLSAAAQAWKQGESNSARLCDIARYTMEDKPDLSLEYLAVAKPHTFEELSEATEGSFILAAAYVGGVRLIDNIILEDSD